jgi:hypothetical protein
MSGLNERIDSRRGAPQDPATEASGVARTDTPPPGPARGPVDGVSPATNADQPAPAPVANVDHAAPATEPPPAADTPRAAPATKTARATKTTRTSKRAPAAKTAGATTAAEAPAPVTEVPAPVTEVPAPVAEVPPAVAEVPAAAVDIPAEAPAPAAPAPVPQVAAARQPDRTQLPSEPGFLARGRMRRRLRYLRRLREIQLRDIGGFVLELHRFDRERPDLLAAKVEATAQTDAELRALEHALDEGHAMREIREPGIGGACENCGAVHGSQDRYCSTCGEPLTGDADADEGDART